MLSRSLPAFYGVFRVGVEGERGRDASPTFYVAPTGLDCSLLLLPRAMPWPTIFRPFGAERNLLYSNPENGLEHQFHPKLNLTRTGRGVGDYPGRRTDGASRKRDRVRCA